MTNLIFEALVAEAQFRVAEHTIKGVAVNEAVAEVAREMELEEGEVQELTARVKKKPSPKPVREDDDIDMDDLMSDMEDDENVKSAADQQTPDNTINFETDQDLETAMGVLMYKGIPWVSRDTTSLSFMTPDHVRDAHEALKRRWDFVNSDDRTVAVLEFDNLADYQKVLDFIASKNMTVTQSTSDELDGDLDMELAEAEADHKKAKKAAKEEGLPAPEEPSHNMSYKALHKDRLLDVKGLDCVSDRSARCLRISKKWK